MARSRPLTRDQICDAAYGLFMAQGYEHTSVQAIIDAVGIAKGTFYYHFRSKEELLDALSERLIEAALAQLRPTVEDEELSAITKFNRSFSAVGAWKLRHRSLFMDLLRTMSDPANALLSLRMTRASQRAMEPILARIVAQGVGEGVFHTRYPEPTARALLHLVSALGEAFERAFLRPVEGEDPRAWLLMELDAFEQAAERLLAAPAGSLRWVDREQLESWLAVIEEAP